MEVATFGSWNVTDFPPGNFIPTDVVTDVVVVEDGRFA